MNKIDESVGNLGAILADRLESQAKDNPLVRNFIRSGGSAEDCINALVEANNNILTRLMQLEAIAPKKYSLNDGSYLIWHCPNHLVPEVKSPGDHEAK